MTIKSFGLSVVLLLLSINGGGQQPTPPQMASIEGTVVDDVTGTPVVGVGIGHRPRGLGTSTTPAGQTLLVDFTSSNFADQGVDTGNDGHFVLGNITPGRISLQIEKTGYISQDLVLTLAPEQNLKGVPIRISPAGIISGRVLHDDGTPAANVVVTPLHYEIMYGNSELISDVERRALTDDRGEFRMPNLV